MLFRLQFCGPNILFIPVNYISIVLFLVMKEFQSLNESLVSAPEYLPLEEEKDTCITQAGYSKMLSSSARSSYHFRSPEDEEKLCSLLLYQY